MNHKRALDYIYLFLERSYECDLLWSVVRSEQRKVMELKLGADLNEVGVSYKWYLFQYQGGEVGGVEVVISVYLAIG